MLNHIENRTLRVAHFSDLHFGPEKLDEAQRCFTQAVTSAICMGAQAAVITGDSSDHALDTHSPSTRALADQLRRLSDHCPVLLLQGTFSHEPPGFLRTLSLCNGKHAISVADSIGHWGLIEGKGFYPYRKEQEKQYALRINALPSLNKAHMAAFMETHGSDEVDDNARAAILRCVAGWQQENIRIRELGIPIMLLSHGTVFGSLSEHGVPMAGNDHELTREGLFAARADAVALGHIHKHQVWKSPYSDQLIAYAGSIGSFHHGENDPKGWIMWEFRTREAFKPTYEFHQTPSRRNVDLVFEGPPDLDAIRMRLSECDGARVRIRYTIDEEHGHNVDRAAIRNLLESAASLKIEGRTLLVTRQRAAGISGVPMAEKLALWAKSTGTLCNGELLARLEMLESACPVEEVVGEVLRSVANQT